MHIHVKTVAVLAAALLITACGGSKSPIAPSSSNSASNGTTAVVSGSVRSGSPLLAATTGGAISGLVVTVAGTAISSGVDAAGRFTLTGVPAGDVRLTFTGAGVNATLQLSQVQPAQTVSLSINVEGASVVVEAEVRSTSSEEQLEGRVESLPPVMDADSLKVGGRTVKVQPATRIEQGGAVRTFDALQIGMRVHVTGMPSGGDVLASVIRIQNTNTWIPVQVNGIIDSFSGSAALFQFKVGSRLVKGDDLSVFFGPGSSTFAALKDGVRVEVKGQQRDGYVYAERIHVNVGDDEEEDEDEDGGQDSSASIEGSLSAIGGTRPALLLTVGGTTVRTSASTEVQRRGDTQSLEALQIGQALHVVGTRQADGSLNARRIQIKDDEAGGEFEIEGSVGGLKGTCPVVSFGVNGFDVRTDGSTVFNGAGCGDLRSGHKVLVKGARQADGSVLAKSVKR